MGSAQATSAQNTPPLTHPKEEKSIIVKITDKDEAKNVKNQSRKDIAHRIQQAAGGTQAAHTVLAVRQLKSGDLAVHMDQGSQQSKPSRLELSRNLVGQRLTSGPLAPRSRYLPLLK